MRVSPVAGGGTFRASSKDIILGGRYKIPAGVLLIPHFYSEFNSPEFWDSADKFLPERWADPDAEYAAPKAANGGSPAGAGNDGAPEGARPRR